MQQQPSDSNEKTPKGAAAGQAKVELSFGDETIESRNGATRSGAKQDWSQLATLLLLTVVGSMLIVLYVGVINLFTAQRKETDVVENAALRAARELAQITVQSSSFGQIGLCDLPASRILTRGYNQTRVISLDRLKETLRIDSEIADRLKQPLIQTLVRKDAALARQIEHELVHRLDKSVAVDTALTGNLVQGEDTDEQDNSVYRNIYKMVSTDREAQMASAVELKIRLGRAKSPILSRDCDAHLVEASNFLGSDGEQAPYLVLIEAIYDRRGKSQEITRITKRACALIAAPAVDAPPAAFAINFPQGVPPQFNSARDILSYRQWTAQGDWQQAVGSEVPGKGSLAPPLEPVMPSMSPGDAMAVALYHWLRTAGAEVDPERTIALLNSKWNKRALLPAPTQKEPSLSFDSTEQSLAPVNSCLALDTGAREYSIMNQTGPGSVGQTALRRAFCVFDETSQSMTQPIFPNSALPLFVDQDGNCNLAGRSGFNSELVRAFLGAVHDSNIAAIASLSTAKQMLVQTTTAISQTEQRIFIEKQELASVTSRLARLQEEASKERPSVPPAIIEGQDDPQRIITLALARVEELKTAIQTGEEDRDRYLRTHKMAVQAAFNANKIASSTFELCSHAFRLCRDGIYQMDAPMPGFIVGRKMVFIPCRTPLREEDFIEPQPGSERTNTGGTEAKIPLPQSPWFAKSLDTVFNLDTAFAGKNDQVIVEGKSLKDILAQTSLAPPFPFGMFVLDSGSIAKSAYGAPVCRGYREYAFSNIAIPSGQLFYYCENAAQTGKQPTVSWSVLLRDLVSAQASAFGEPSTGNPIPSQERDWCANHDNGQCPGLACELQIRCPLPVSKEFSEGSYLKSPSSNSEIPQIPPVPPDML